MRQNCCRVVYDLMEANRMMRSCGALWEQLSNKLMDMVKKNE
jgi:hypothetical protein